MEKILKIEGMSCKNCVKHVVDALSEIKNVTTVEVSLEEKTATVEMSSDIEQTILVSAIEDAGYDVVE
ncbi:MAG: copper chaperone [bacterium]|jgi:copper chaperone